MRIPHDFSQLVQVTYLGFNMHGCVITVKLPQGNCVALQQLNLNSCCKIFGLEYATELDMMQILEYQYIRGTLQWPACLPQLREIFVAWPSCTPDRFYALPEVWRHYSNLETICLPPFAAAEFPHWLTELQRLKHLEMESPVFPKFPKCLSQLVGLEHLDLSGIETMLTQDIVGLAELPRLTELNFGQMLCAEEVDTEFDEGQKHLDDEEEEHIEQLEQALESRAVPMYKEEGCLRFNFCIAQRRHLKCHSI